MLLTEEFARPQQVPGLEVELRPARPAELPDRVIDVAGLQAAWRSVTDTHQFFCLLSKFKVSRTQTLRLRPHECVQIAPLDAARWVLNGAVQHAVPIMVFVGNPGMIQIHSGPIANVQVMGP